MHDDFRRFLPPCSSKRFLLFFFPVWFSVFFAAVPFQTFSTLFFHSLVFCFFGRRAIPNVFYLVFCQCGFLFFCPPCVFGSVFLLRGSPTVLFSRRSVRLACGKKMEKKSAVATVKKKRNGPSAWKWQANKD